MLYKILFILSIVFLITGLIAVYWDSIKKLFHKLLFTEKKPSLKTRLEILTGDINKHFFRKQIHEAKEALAGTGRANWFGVVRLASVLLFLAGLFSAVIMKNFLLVPILSLLGVMLPFFYVKHVANRYKDKLNTDLEDALFAMTYNYMTSDNFIAVVRGLCSVDQGIDQGNYFQLLAFTYRDRQNQLLKKEALKRPDKIASVSFLGCFAAGVQILVILGTQFVENMGVFNI